MSQTSLRFCPHCKETQTHRAAIDADGRSIIVCMGCRMYLPGPASNGEEPTMNVITSRTLHYRNDSENADKVYIIQLVEAGKMYGVRFAYGPRVGRALMTGWKCGGTSRGIAEGVFSKVGWEKTSKGYEPWEAGFNNYRPDWKEPPWQYPANQVSHGRKKPDNDEMAEVLKVVKTPPQPEENPEEMGLRARLFEIWSMSEAEQVALKPEVEQLERKLQKIEAKA